MTEERILVFKDASSFLFSNEKKKSLKTLCISQVTTIDAAAEHSCTTPLSSEESHDATRFSFLGLERELETYVCLLNIYFIYNYTNRALWGGQMALLTSIRSPKNNVQLHSPPQLHTLVPATVDWNTNCSAVCPLSGLTA